jgi:hypothetical protein
MLKAEKMQERAKIGVTGLKPHCNRPERHCIRARIKGRQADTLQMDVGQVCALAGHFGESPK